MAKMTMLDKYRQAFAEIAGQSPIPLERVWTYQELLYRMEVLQVCQMLSASAPVGNNMQAMLTHYRMTDGYLEALKTERRYGTAANEEEQKQRDTAHQNLCRVVADYRKRFSSFSPSAPDQYKNEIGKTINTFLPAWLQVRSLYIKINTKEAQQ